MLLQKLEELHTASLDLLYSLEISNCLFYRNGACPMLKAVVCIFWQFYFSRKLLFCSSKIIELRILRFCPFRVWRTKLRNFTLSLMIREHVSWWSKFRKFEDFPIQSFRSISPSFGADTAAFQLDRMVIFSLFPSILDCGFVVWWDFEKNGPISE